MSVARIEICPAWSFSITREQEGVASRMSRNKAAIHLLKL
jgi:hypothetical protein